MSFRSLGLLLLFLLIVQASFGQEGLRVTVLDKDSRQPVMLAYVNVYSTNRTIQATEQTDEQGIATVSPQYPCTIEIVALGYEPFSQNFHAAPANPVLTVLLVKKYSSMNEVVVTGTSQPTRMKDALSNYQVISKAQIQSMGAVTLNEALRNQINIQIGNDNILGSNIQMQGLSGNKVKILIDGVPVNGREAGNINLSQINLNNVERIEMIQGPMSVVYGTDALGGIINVITKKENKPYGINVGTYYETIGRYNINASVTHKIKEQHQLTIGGARNYFDGWGYRDTPIVAPGGYKKLVQRNLFFKPNEQYVGNLAYIYTAPKSGFRMHLASDFLKEKVTNKGSLDIWNSFEARAKDEYYNTIRSMNRISLSGRLGKKGSWQSQNGYNIYYRTRNTYVVDMTTMKDSLSSARGSQDTSRFDDITSRSSYSNSYKKISYTAGYDVAFSYANSMKIPMRDTSIKDYALYANVSIPLVQDKLTTQAGLRTAHNTAYKAPLIPSFNLLYTPTKNIQVRGSYAKGFRAPSLKELYLSFIDQNHYILGATDLKAETSHHIQMSASYQAYERQADYLQFIVTGYYNNVKNGIMLIPVHPNDPTSIEYIYGNLFRQRNTIASFQVDGQWQDLHFQLGYSRNFTVAEKGRYNGFNTGEATATIQYTWEKPGVSFNIINKFLEARPRVIAGIDGVPTYNGHQDAYNMLDLTAEKNFWKRRLQLTAGIKNVLDVRQVNVTGAVVTNSAHGDTGGTSGFLPRSFFTSLKLAID